MSGEAILLDRNHPAVRWQSAQDARFALVYERVGLIRYCDLDRTLD